MRVFKYRGGEFERDLKSLSEDFFWAPTRENLNDPCEGLFNQKSIDSQLNMILKVFSGNNENTSSALQEIKNSLKALFEFVDKSGIYSLSKTPLEELLWAHYGYSHTGFCIEYDLDKLVEYEKNDYFILNVRYKNVPQSINVHDINNSGQDKILNKMLGIKSKPWRYESEVRVVTSTSGKHNYDFRAVKAIYFGLRISEANKNMLMEVLQGRGIKYHQITLKPESYKFSFVQVNDIFPNSIKYKYSIAPIAKYAISPDYVSEKYKTYTDYLYKASEIVRREPDCNEVEMVEFSSSKGDINNPVIFVQYKRKENRHVNHYLSIKDIEEQYSKITDLGVNVI